MNKLIDTIIEEVSFWKDGKTKIKRAELSLNIRSLIYKFNKTRVLNDVVLDNVSNCDHEWVYSGGAKSRTCEKCNKLELHASCY